MKVSVNQRCILIVILAMIFVLALVRGIMQTYEAENAINNQAETSVSYSRLSKVESELDAVDVGTIKAVKINTASAAEIAKNLEGIGDAIASRIVLRRQQYGPYRNFEQLKAVSGVGMAKIEANKQRISFD